MTTGRPVPPADYPGRTAGVTGLILSIVIGLPGLVVSAIALRSSKRAGFRNTPAFIGVIIGIIATVLLVVVVILVVALITQAQITWS